MKNICENCVHLKIFSFTGKCTNNKSKENDKIKMLNDTCDKCFVMKNQIKG